MSRRDSITCRAHTASSSGQGTSALLTLQLWEKATPNSRVTPTQDRDEMEIHSMAMLQIPKDRNKTGWPEEERQAKRTKITPQPQRDLSETTHLDSNKITKASPSQFHLIMPFCSKLGSQQTTDTPLFPHFASPTPPRPSLLKGKQKGKEEL